jgi:hypothetical protein
VRCVWRGVAGFRAIEIRVMDFRVIGVRVIGCNLPRDGSETCFGSLPVEVLHQPSQGEASIDTLRIELAAAQSREGPGERMERPRRETASTLTW